MSTLGERLNAAAAGTVTIGDLEINRVGFGTMRIVGPGVLGPPPDLASAVAALRALPELAVNFVDTANSYGPFISEILVRETLQAYRGTVVATSAPDRQRSPGYSDDPSRWS